MRSVMVLALVIMTQLVGASAGFASVYSSGARCENIWMSESGRQANEIRSSVMSGARELTFPLALEFIVESLPSQEERDKVRSIIERRMRSIEASRGIITRSGWSSRLRLGLHRTTYLGEGVVWHVKPIRSEEAFYREIFRAVDLLAQDGSWTFATWISVYRKGAQSHKAELLEAAENVLNLKSMVFANSSGRLELLPQPAHWSSKLLKVIGSIFMESLLPIEGSVPGLLKLDREIYSLQTAGERVNLLEDLRRRYGFVSTLKYYLRHMNNLSQATLASVIVMIAPMSPEIAQTTWHQYQTETPAADLKADEPSVKLARRLMAASAQELRREARRLLEQKVFEQRNPSGNDLNETDRALRDELLRELIKEKER